MNSWIIIFFNFKITELKKKSWATVFAWFVFQSRSVSFMQEFCLDHEGLAATPLWVFGKWDSSKRNKFSVSISSTEASIYVQKDICDIFEQLPHARFSDVVSFVLLLQQMP